VICSSAAVSIADLRIQRCM